MQFVVSDRSKIVYSTKKMAKKGHYSDVYWLSEKSVTLSNPPHAIRPSSKRKNTNKLFDLPDEYSLFHTTFIFIHIKERPTNNTHRWLAMRTYPPSDFTAKYWPIFIYARRLTQPYTLHIGTVEAGQKKEAWIASFICARPPPSNNNSLITVNEYFLSRSSNEHDGKLYITEKLT